MGTNAGATVSSRVGVGARARRGRRGAWARASAVLGVAVAACAAPQPPHAPAREVAPPAAAAPAPTDPRVDALGRHAIRIAPRPFDGPLDDLAPLRPMLSGARLVGLGEQSHRDGTTFAAKLRLVRFLHEEMGFDTLAIESPRWACHKAWEGLLDPSVAPVDAAKRCVFGIWTAPAEMQALWTYLAREAKGPRPLRLVGVDMQVGDTERRELVGELRAFLGAEGRRLARELDDVAFLLERVKDWKNPPPREVAVRVVTSLATLSLALGKRRDPNEARAWLATLDDLQVLVRWTWRDPPPSDDDPLRTSNPRDRRMAQHARDAVEASPGGVVLWAATMHLARGVEGIEQLDPQIPPDAYAGAVPMGATLHEELGDAYVAVGFFAAGGAAGSNAKPRPLEPARAGSLEALLAATGATEAVLDMRATRRDDVPELAFLGDPLEARPLGYLRQRARWPSVVDVAYFTKDMAPVTLPPPQSPGP